MKYLSKNINRVTLLLLVLVSFLQAASPLPKPHLSAGANRFLNEYPKIAEYAKSTLPEDSKNNRIHVVRPAYEELAKKFSGPAFPFDHIETKIIGRNQQNIDLRLYYGKNPEKIIFLIHGGGWVRGSLDTHNQFCKEICQRTGYSVYSIAYRLAPENPYPAALIDVEDAFDWLIKGKTKNQKILVLGDSAGGNLAAALCVKRIEENQSLPDGLLLLYPVVDLENGDAPNPHALGYGLTNEVMGFYIKSYLGENYLQLTRDSKVSPIYATAKTLSKFPKTLIIAAEYDPLTISIKQFAQALRTAKGLHTSENLSFSIIPKTIHIFAQFPSLFEEAKQAMGIIARKAAEF